jgi:hypothetical protein
MAIRCTAAMRDVKADLFDWAQDYEAVITAAKAALPIAAACTCWATAWARNCRAC